MFKNNPANHNKLRNYLTSHFRFSFLTFTIFLKVKPTCQWSIMMDVLTRVASIAFSLYFNKFNSFVQYSDYHLVSATLLYQFAPISPTTLFLAFEALFVWGFKAISYSWRSAILKRLYLIQVDIRGALTSKNISDQKGSRHNFPKRLPDKQGYDITFG